MSRRAEALAGGRSFNELRDLVTNELRAKHQTPGTDRWVYVRDMTDTWAVCEFEGAGTPEPGFYQVTYSISAEGAVTLSEPTKVEARTTYQVTEAAIPGRLIEAKGTDDAGGRVFGFRIVEGGTVGRNRRRYPESVLSAAIPLYEGAKAFDRHRTDADLKSSTISGLVGQWRNVRAAAGGLDADLHLLPSATHTAEALDASLAAVAAKQPPLVGASHDVYGRFRVAVEGGQRIEEATEISSVNSIDVVADPAAGGRVTRMVAGGIEPDPTPDPQEEPMDLDALLKQLAEATPEQKASLAGALGVTPATTTTPPPSGTTTTTETDAPKEPVLVGAAESLYAKDSVLGRQVLRGALAEAKLPERALESIDAMIPARFTEADIADLLKRFGPSLERMGLAPTVPDVTVGQEAVDRKREALEAMFAGDYRKGYRSLKEAFIDYAGFDSKRFAGPASEDFNRHVLRESFVITQNGLPSFYDGGSRRATESVDTTTWAELFGDVLHKRMIAEYGLQGLDAWRRIVSSMPPVPDFRTQKPMRMGGYGVLPIVPERAPYQALTTPGDEQVTWDVDKRGGTEDWSLEAVANDDLRRLQQIPQKLGRAAAQTLFRFVFDFLRTNPTMDYDSTALFAAGHGNTDTSAALTQSTLSTGRRKMRLQTAFGNSTEVLGAVPRTLVVPSSLEEIAFQLSTSAVAIPSTPAGPSNTPNIHQGLDVIVVDYFSDQDDWFLVADTRSVPTIEVGFYQGREEPELFTQADPTQGSVFNADVFTIKIRHIYGGDVLDHRGMYRGQG